MSGGLTTGDPIEVFVNGKWQPRVFLVEFDGKVWYTNPQRSSGFCTEPKNVRRPAPPLTLKVGDVLHKGESATDFVVFRVTDTHVYLAYAGRLTGSPYTELVPLPLSPEWHHALPAGVTTWTDPVSGKVYRSDRGYRDNDGDVWRFTGRYEANGEPRVSYTGSLSSLNTISAIDSECGPLVEVP